MEELQAALLDQAPESHCFRVLHFLSNEYGLSDKHTCATKFSQETYNETCLLFIQIETLVFRKLILPMACIHIDQRVVLYMLLNCDRFFHAGGGK